MASPSAPPDGRAGRRVALLGVVIAAAALAAGLPGLNEVGVTWDEPRYFESVERIQGWTADVFSAGWRDALSPEGIREAWDVDRYYNPHPPFYKAAMAVTEAAAGRWLGVPGAYRLSSLLMFGLLAGLVTFWTARLVVPAAGVAAGLSIALMPRVFGHAHVGATDMPLTLLWFVATLAFVFHVRERRRRWLLLAGVAAGCAFATKFTALLLPVPLAAWMLLRSGARSRRMLAAGAGALALALLVAVLVNPAAWPDPVGYQLRLVSESLAREAEIPISTYYLGEVHRFEVPWHHAVVMTAATLPAGVAALALLGSTRLVRAGAVRSAVVLCLLQVAFWWCLLALPDSPNHDGVRLWLPMFPFVAMLAGVGFGTLAEAVERRVAGVRGRAALVAVGVLFFVPALFGALRTAPYYLSHYGELVGGAAGAERRGLETTYWFDAFTASFRGEVERTLPDGARVVAFPNAEYYALLQGMGLLRPDLRFVDAPPADHLLLLGRKALLHGGWEAIYRRSVPLLAVELEGVELMGLYEWDEREAAEAAGTGEGS